MKYQRFLVTGGCGFIGSALIRHLCHLPHHRVLNIDKMTYAAAPHTALQLSTYTNYRHIKMDIIDEKTLAEVVHQYKPEVIIHLAAESHVDNSIGAPDAFIQTNILGTYNLLKVALEYWHKLPKSSPFRFHHVSTDEVYGCAAEGTYFDEKTAYAPNSPYSASKASSDFLVRAWHKTYGLPVTMSNCSNNYGPYQFPEKLIPRLITNALYGQSLPIYGSGKQVRDWLFVSDHVEALLRIINHGQVGECYTIGGNCEKENIDIATHVCDILDKLAPASSLKSYRELITYVSDRPGHDFRYAVNSSKMKEQLDWEPRVSFEQGLTQTITWYLENPLWWQNLQSKIIPPITRKLA